MSEKLNSMGVTSKQRTDRHGRVTGGKAFSRGALYNILRNPIYIWKTRHKDMLHDGVHDAIVEEDLWNAAQEMLKAHGGKEIAGQRHPAKRMFDGLLFDTRGRPMGTTYASKSVDQNGARRTKRYWYYVSKTGDARDTVKAQRVPTRAIEDVVLKAVQDRLANQSWLADALREQTKSASLISQILDGVGRLIIGKTTDANDTHANLGSMTQRVDLMTDTIRITLDLNSIVPTLIQQGELRIGFDIPFTLHQKGRVKPIVITTNTPASRPDAELISLVANPKRWMAELLDGHAASVQDITDREHLRSGAVSRILPLAFLAPDIATAVPNGHQPASLRAKIPRDLKDLPMDWAEQRRVLGF